MEIITRSAVEFCRADPVWIRAPRSRFSELTRAAPDDDICHLEKVTPIGG